MTLTTMEACNTLDLVITNEEDFADDTKLIINIMSDEVHHQLLNYLKHPVMWPAKPPSPLGNNNPTHVKNMKEVAPDCSPGITGPQCHHRSGNATRM